MESSATKKAILFLSGQAVSLFGSALVQYAITWHITLTTGSAIMLTISILCGFLPQGLISLLSGVWADRFNRKRLIILADGMIAFSTAILALLFMLGHDYIWLLFVISAVRSVGAGIQMPAVSAFLSEIVPQENLMRVNGINASIRGAIGLLSPAAAGGLYAAAEQRLASIFWVDVLTAVIGIALLLFIKTGVRQTAERQTRHVFTEMRSGLKYVLETRWLKHFMGFNMVFMLMFAPVAFLTPMMVKRSFGEEPWRLVANEMVFAVGMTISGLLVGILAAKFRNKVVMVVAGCGAFGLMTLLMGFSPNFLYYLIVMLAMGTTIPVVNSGAMTVLQQRVQPEFMGRVFSLVTITEAFAMPFSMLVFGPIADVVSIELLLIITGAFMVAIVFLMTRAKEVFAAGVSVTNNEQLTDNNERAGETE